MNKAFLPFLVIFLMISCEAEEAFQEKEEKELISIGVKEKMFSKILDEEREVWVHMPKGFYGMDEQTLNYPVVYVIDGESQFLSTVGVLEQLSSAASANDISPQMIVVGITNTDRNRDLTPNPGIIGKDSSSINRTGGAGQFAEFIKEELMPFIDEKYPTSNHRTLIGHSLGGLFTLNTLLKFPDLFDYYLAIDPFMRWDEQRFSNQVLEALKTKDYPNKKLYIATANSRMSWMSLSDVKEDTTEIMKMMKCNLAFKESLDSSEIQLQYLNKYYEEENHFQIPLIATYDAFRYFYADYHFPKMMDYYYPRSKEEEGDLVRELEDHYGRISKDLRFKVLPMESYINSWAFGFIQFDRADIAGRLFDYNIKNYPKSANVYASKGYYLINQKDTLQATQYFEEALKRKELPHVRDFLEKL